LNVIRRCYLRFNGTRGKQQLVKNPVYSMRLHSPLRQQNQKEKTKKSQGQIRHLTDHSFSTEPRPRRKRSER
jgi:hypothetical protein